MEGGVFFLELLQGKHHALESCLRLIQNGCPEYASELFGIGGPLQATDQLLRGGIGHLMRRHERSLRLFREGIDASVMVKAASWRAIGGKVEGRRQVQVAQ